MIGEKLLYLTPEYQRQAGIWDLKRKSQLIESLLLNIPIPTIYCMENESPNITVWEIIDGLQRISTINDFYNNKFKLKYLDELKDFNGVNYTELSNKSIKAKYMIDRAVLPIVLIKKESDEGIKFDVFERLNTGSVKLNNQELRNCIYRGTFNNLLIELGKNEIFSSMIFTNLKKNKRMQDIEIILRFFAIHANIDTVVAKFDKDFYDKNRHGILKGYNGSIKPFLNNFMNINRNQSMDWIKQQKELFIETIELVYEVFGMNAFRRGEKVKVLNLSIFDMIMSSFAMYNYKLIRDKKDEVKTQMIELLKTDEMNNLISKGTNSKEKTNKRFILWFNKMWDILNA